MTIAVAKLTSKGQLTLPKEVRDRLGLSQADEVEFAEEAGVLVLRKLVRSSPFARYEGCLKDLEGADPDQITSDLHVGSSHHWHVV